jgi:streptogramin lyase
VPPHGGLSIGPLTVGPHGVWLPVAASPLGTENFLLRIDPSTNQVALKLNIDGVYGVADWPGGVWAGIDADGAHGISGGSHRGVVQLDTQTGRILRTVILGSNNQEENYLADGFTFGLGSLWAIVADRTIVRVDVASGKVTAAIRTPWIPNGFANIALVGTHAYVAQQDLTIARIDAETNCVDGLMYIGGQPNSMAVIGGADGLYVGFDKGALAAVDPMSLAALRSVRVDDQDAQGAAADAFGSIWYPTFGRNSVLRLSPLA